MICMYFLYSLYRYLLYCVSMSIYLFYILICLYSLVYYIETAEKEVKYCKKNPFDGR